MIYAIESRLECTTEEREKKNNAKEREIIAVAARVHHTIAAAESKNRTTAHGFIGRFSFENYKKRKL